jgi:hypothetical protein
MVEAPNTTIQNRAKLPDLSNDLKASFGIERIAIKGVYQIHEEIGPNGEMVFGGINDSRGLARFVGSGWRNVVSTSGTRAYATNFEDYVEITFYGTALNLLIINFAGRDLRVSVDGQPEGSNILTEGSGILGNRRYSPNVVYSVASGLSLGVHTVKIRLANNGIGSPDFAVYGFEIVNTASASNISINPGSAYVGGSRYLAVASQSLPYSGQVTGTKGGRTLIYLSPDGLVSQVFTPVSANTLYMAAASHSNEEVARVYYPREFGAGRTDDFVRLTAATTYAAASTGDRAYTLDDGTTTLTASSGAFVTYLTKSPATKEGLICKVTSGTKQISFAFVGTGLDVELLIDGNTRKFDTITIDDVIVATDVTKSASTDPEIRKLASGLPYGTHVVKFAISGTQESPAIGKFIVYQPKKPSIPETAVELADYNVMADYVANTSATLSPSQGVLRKYGTRELTYTGMWTIYPDVSFSGGFGIRSSMDEDGNQYNYFEYTFFGTGIEHRTFFQASSAINWNYSIDGSTNLSSYATSVYSPNLGTVSFNPATGNLSGTSGSGSSHGTTVSIRGLPLGIHKIKVVFTPAFYGHVDSLDIITPVHSYRSGLLADTKNNADVGSNSLSDSRRTSVLKESLAPTKAWAQVTANSSLTATVGTAVPCSELSCTVKTSGGPIQISYSINITSASTSCEAYIYVDGVMVGKKSQNQVASTAVAVLSDTFLTQVSPGLHRIDIYWLVSGTVTATDRILTVFEI